MTTLTINLAKLDQLNLERDDRSRSIPSRIPPPRGKIWYLDSKPIPKPIPKINAFDQFKLFVRIIVSATQSKILNDKIRPQSGRIKMPNRPKIGTR